MTLLDHGAVISISETSFCFWLSYNYNKRHENCQEIVKIRLSDGR